MICDIPGCVICINVEPHDYIPLDERAKLLKDASDRPKLGLNLTAITFPGYKGEPSHLPGMQKVS